MADTCRATPAQAPEGATGVMVFADGRTAWGMGFGAEGQAVGELCFNTAMTGYQEVMTDPSYARQVVAFTFPHIGNVGANAEDVEAEAHALGCIVREAVTARPASAPAGFSELDGATWPHRHHGLDTRALTRLVRKEGPPTIVIAHRANGNFDLDALQQWLRTGRASRAWTWPRRSAASSSRRGAAASGSWAPATASAATT